ncbi:hypothetical protein FRC09_012527 [Ceratobasidium sp. 395]|nr:hypothetical protein FRC09_012527 [Ceratobasidium sp. 395]
MSKIPLPQRSTQLTEAARLVEDGCKASGDTEYEVTRGFADENQVVTFVSARRCSYNRFTLLGIMTGTIRDWTHLKKCLLPHLTSLPNTPTLNATSSDPKQVPSRTEVVSAPTSSSTTSLQQAEMARLTATSVP